MNMFDKNSEASFVLNGVFEFIKVWQSGSKSTLKLHSKNGKAWINFDCCLGGPLDQHEKLVPKPKPKSKKKQERDNLRAQLHQQRLQGKNQASNWDSKLQQQDAIWQKMFNRNPKTNLFPLCLEFFKDVKQEMNDEEFFNQLCEEINWLKFAWN